MMAHLTNLMQDEPEPFDMETEGPLVTIFVDQVVAPPEPPGATRERFDRLHRRVVSVGT